MPISNTDGSLASLPLVVQLSLAAGICDDAEFASRETLTIERSTVDPDECVERAEIYPELNKFRLAT